MDEKNASTKNEREDGEVKASSEEKARAWT